MRAILSFGLMLHIFFHFSTAQISISSQPPATTSSISLTPEMSASAVSSLYSVLATSTPLQSGSPSAGDVGASSGSADNEAGASGPDSGSITLSKGGIIAIIVAVVGVIIFGVVSAVLWYLAKKRSWEVRKTLRRSAKKVVTALTPRRTTFPKDVQRIRRSSRGLTKIDEVPDSPKIRNKDVEKGHPKLTPFEMAEPPKESKWTRKFGR